MSAYPPAPAGLTARARRAYHAILEASPTPALLAASAAELAQCVDRSDRLRAEWIKAGRPMTSKGSAGQLRVHPLVEAMENAAASVRLAALDNGASVEAVRKGMPAGGRIPLVGGSPGPAGLGARPSDELRSRRAAKGGA